MQVVGTPSFLDLFMCKNGLQGILPVVGVFRAKIGQKCIL